MARCMQAGQHARPAVPSTAPTPAWPATVWRGSQLDASESETSGLLSSAASGRTNGLATRVYIMLPLVNIGHRGAPKRHARPQAAHPPPSSTCQAAPFPPKPLTLPQAAHPQQAAHPAKPPSLNKPPTLNEPLTGGLAHAPASWRTQAAPDGATWWWAPLCRAEACVGTSSGRFSVQRRTATSCYEDTRACPAAAAAAGPLLHGTPLETSGVPPFFAALLTRGVWDACSCQLRPPCAQ